MREVAARCARHRGHGLRARAALDSIGGSEDGFLTTLREIVAKGETSADELLRKFRGEWGGDLTHVLSRIPY